RGARRDAVEPGLLCWRVAEVLRDALEVFRIVTEPPNHRIFSPVDDATDPAGPVVVVHGTTLPAERPTTQCADAALEGEEGVVLPLGEAVHLLDPLGVGAGGLLALELTVAGGTARPGLGCRPGLAATRLTNLLHPSRTSTSSSYMSQPLTPCGVTLSETHDSGLIGPWVWSMP